MYYATEIHATSFDLEFFGPDAATLNGIVSEHIAGGDVCDLSGEHLLVSVGDDFAIMHVWVRMASRHVFCTGHRHGSLYALPDRRGRLPRRGAGTVLDLSPSTPSWATSAARATTAPSSRWRAS